IGFPGAGDIGRQNRQRQGRKSQEQDWSFHGPWIVGYGVIVTKIVRASILKQQRSEFTQTAPPALPFVSGVRRYVKVRVHAGCLERRGIRFGIAAAICSIAAKFAAAVTDEQDFDLFL